MANASVTDPSDMDPISQTVMTANAINFKNSVDTQLQLNQLMLSNTIHNQTELNKYSMQALARTENVNTSNTGVVTAASAKSVKTLVDSTSDALADAITGDIASKTADNTPPVYSDPVNYQNMINSVTASVTQAIAASLAANTTTAKTSTTTTTGSTPA